MCISAKKCDKEQPMENTAMIVATVLLLGYLFYALLRPEKF